MKCLHSNQHTVPHTNDPPVVQQERDPAQRKGGGLWGRRGHEAKQEGNLGGIQDEKNADVVQVDSVFFCWCDGTQVNLKYFVQHL